MESYNDSIAARVGFFHHCIGDTLCQLAFLLSRAAGQHRYLNEWHRGRLPTSTHRKSVRSVQIPLGQLLRQFVTREKETQLKSGSIVSIGAMDSIVFNAC